MLLVKRSTQLPGGALYPNDKSLRKGRREEGKRALAFPWSLALCHQSLAFRARLLDAKPC